ncbi:endonuclease [Burkholderia phage Mica]|uniref:Nuclease n=1 Tax=Burkholderia phage Mica TaxID=2767579 RepID=A0A873WBQ8_9CAUD|nr:endonuclease [Burkholderia phage Mica]QPB08660.1 nuclease [Burkholderia phage Mica]
MSEHKIQNDIRNALAGECMLFRANVGRAWTGSDFIRLPNGDMLIKNPRPFDTGLPPGFGDLFGLATRIITAEMIGQKVGVYVAADVKTSTGRVTPKQAAYLRAVNDNGGCADVWRSPADALATVARAKGKV